MAKKPETALQRKMIDRIMKLPCPSFARKVHGTRYGSGEPDIDAVIHGVPLKVEVKMPGNVPTELQANRLIKWESAGAVTGWVTTMEQLDVLICVALRRAGDTDIAEQIEEGSL